VTITSIFTSTTSLHTPYYSCSDLRRGLTDQARALSEKDAKLAQKLGQLQSFYRCIPTGMDGPTCIFWANITPFSRRCVDIESAEIAVLKVLSNLLQS
jgi:hypothetical protein